MALTSRVRLGTTTLPKERGSSVPRPNWRSRIGPRTPRRWVPASRPLQARLAGLKTDFAVRLDPSRLHTRQWIRNPYKGWKEFNERSISRLNSRATSYVVVADIAGYFESINLELLRSDLERIECPREATTVIERCLREWAPSPDRGLPQGILASDLLAKLYLETLDHGLVNLGLRHVRYVDDIRIFCRDEPTAREALISLTQLCRARGLSLQSAKTGVHRAAEVRARFEGVRPLIRDVHRAYIEDAVIRGLMAADESVPLLVLDQLFKDDPEAVDMTIIRKTFTDHIATGAAPTQTVLRFVLNRLAKANDDFGVETCGRLLLECPEHTGTVLRYFDRLSRKAAPRKLLLATLRARTSAIYSYQRYLILDWYLRNEIAPNQEELGTFRTLAFSALSPSHCRAPARQLIGRHGNPGDLESLVELFRATSDPLERAQLLSCLRNLERRRRNTIAGRNAQDPGWVGRAARLVRSHA